VAPGATIEEELVEMARQTGELGPQESMRPTLRAFADRVSGRCALIGDHYGDWDRNAGDHIRAVMHEVPDLMPNNRPDDERLCE